MGNDLVPMTWMSYFIEKKYFNPYLTSINLRTGSIFENVYGYRAHILCSSKRVYLHAKML